MKRNLQPMTDEQQSRANTMSENDLIQEILYHVPVESALYVKHLLHVLRCHHMGDENPFRGSAREDSSAAIASASA